MAQIEGENGPHQPRGFRATFSAFLDGLGPEGRSAFQEQWRAIMESEAFKDILLKTAAGVMEEERRRSDTVAEVVDEVMAILRKAGAPGPSTSARAIPGLTAAVRVALDGYGAAHVRAESEADAHRAQGYLTAQDRLWQMDLLRRIASGRAAEILGAPMLESDKHFLVYGFAAVAESAVDNLRADVKEILEAYAGGVNARIGRYRDEGWPWEFQLLAYEPEPWRPADSILVVKLQSEALSNSWLNDILREEFVNLPEHVRKALFDETSPLDVIVFGSDQKPERSPKPLVALDVARRAGRREWSCIGDVVARKRTRAGALRLASLYSPGRAVSNNWVISGKRTENGAPLLANDPHLQVAMPGIWHLVELAYGDVDFAGATIPGIPGILIGHNAHVAWGITNVGADVQDLYWEKVDPESPDEYETPFGPRKMEIFEHTIRVRRGLDGYSEETFVARATRHGPIVFEARGDAYALTWPALNATKHELPGFYDLARAKSAEQARAALSHYDGPPQNFVYADRDGNIGAQIAGCVLERPSGSLGLPRDGAAAQESSPKLLEFDRLPHVANPQSGIITTANNRTVGLDYPYSVTHEWAAPYRVRRIFDLLRARAQSGVAYSLAVQGDTFSVADWIFVSEVVRMARYHAVSDARWQAMIAIFGDWDGSTTLESVAVTVSASMRRAFSRRVLRAVLDPELLETYLRWETSFRFIDELLRERPTTWLPDGFESYEDVVLAAFDEAIVELAGRFGTDVSAWCWGAVAPAIEFAHPLATLAPQIVGALRYQLPNGTGGGGPTVDAGAYVSMRFVADLSDWNETRLGLPLGQSGDVRSPHFADQLESWVAVDPPRFAFGERAFAEAKEFIELVPPENARPRSQSSSEALVSDKREREKAGGADAQCEPGSGYTPATKEAKQQPEMKSGPSPSKSGAW